MTQRWLIYHWSHALKWLYTRSILTRNAASHERCRLCAVDLRCLTETAPDDHRAASCGEFSSGQTTATGTQLTWDLNCVLKHLSAHQKNTHKLCMEMEFVLCVSFSALLNFEFALNIILFSSLGFSTREASSPHDFQLRTEAAQMRRTEIK